MATAAPITGAPECAPRFRDFDLAVLDQLCARMDVVRTLIDTAIDHITNDAGRATNLAFAALDLWKSAADEAGEIHVALVHCQRRELGE